MDLSAGVREDLGALRLDPGRPLIAVDADEVLVAFAGPLGDWLGTQGVVMRLTTYRLEGSMRRGAAVLDKAECLDLIDRFFAEAVGSQPALDGAADALARLSARAQVVILTNVPRPARAARIANLAGHGIDYPLVANEGPKGAALAWLAARTAGIAFVDDSPHQIASAAAHVPQGLHIHFTGSPLVQAILPPAPEAHHVARDWAEAEAQLRAGLQGLPHRGPGRILRG